MNLAALVIKTRKQMKPEAATVSKVMRCILHYSWCSAVRVWQCLAV